MAWLSGLDLRREQIKTRGRNSGCPVKREKRCQKRGIGADVVKSVEKPLGIPAGRGCHPQKLVLKC